MEVTDRNDDLMSRWMGLWMSLGVSPGRVPDLYRLMSAYESPSRHYHTLRHIRDCLQELDSCRSSLKEPGIVEAALWFHDAVYDATRHDNEEKSAELASRTLVAAGVSKPVIDHIQSLILGTKHNSPPADGDACYLVDIDLSILGRSETEFDEYERAIRLEYQHVAEEAFRAGRAAILQKLIERPHIYSTSRFQERYEQPAKENLRRSIERLLGAD
jgi:predicted metal-dependent HD superfamily phosphohydrolase